MEKQDEKLEELERLIEAGELDDMSVIKGIIRRRLRAYPHAEPEERTVSMVAEGLIAVIDVSNAWSEKFAEQYKGKDEPWLKQSPGVHCVHASNHAARAVRSISQSRRDEWLSDLGQPEIAHCCLRSMMALYKYAEETK